jgi:uncharacterized membrane protein
VQLRHQLKLRKRINNFAENLTPIRFFTITAAIFGLIFIAITPPFQTPDEPIHFYREYQISTGHLLLEQHDRVAGGYLPKSLAKTVSVTADNPTLKFDPNAKYTVHKTKEALSIDLKPESKQLYDLSATAYYSPIAYIPQAIGVLMARLAHMPPVLMMYLGRAMNLAAWITLIGLAIRFMPYRKWAMVSIGLLPMAVFDSISLGADVMFYGLLAVSVALILRAAYKKEQLSTHYLIVLTAILAALTLTKQIGFLFVFLVLLIPTISLGIRRRELQKRAALLLIPLAVFGTWFILISQLNLLNTSDFHPEPSAQTKFILERPFGYLNVLYRTYFFTPSDGVARSFIGNFGWVDAPLSELIANVGYIGLAFLLLVGYGKQRPSRLSRLSKFLLMLIGLLYALAVTTALYIYYNPLHYKTIIGLQGRYFWPLLVLAIPLFYDGSRRILTTRQLYRHATMGLSLLLLITSAITIYYRYYITF